MIVLTEVQKLAKSFMLKNKYSILALKMGLGKSLASLEVCKEVGGRTLIVCPSYLILNWKNEIRHWYGTDFVLQIFKKSRDIYFPFDSDFVIVSYDIAIKSDILFEWADNIICDEAHYLMNSEAKRTEQIHRLIYENSIKRVMLLTGTPIKNRVRELYSLLCICNYNPESTSDFLSRYPNYVEFSDRFSFRTEYTMILGNGRRFKVVKWDGVQREDELKKYLLPVLFTKKVPDTAKTIFKEVLISETNDEKLLEEFDKFQKDESSINATAKAAAALAKVPFTAKYVKDLLDQGFGPIPIYTDHVESCLALAKIFQVPAITGKMNANDRQKEVEKFRSGQVNIICATIKSLSTGINLTNANHLVFNDYPWTPGDMDQTIYRINRIGQSKDCIIHNILGSIQDAYILKAVNQKRDTASKIINT